VYKDKKYYSDLLELIKTESIWPFGDYDYLNVTAKHEKLEEYPHVVKIGSIDHVTLFNDYKSIYSSILAAAEEEYNELDNTIAPQMIEKGFDPKDGIYGIHLAGVGNLNNFYCNKIHDKDTGEFFDFIPKTTLDEIEKFGTAHRSEYFVKPEQEYETNWHIDYGNDGHFKHGFRILMPLSCLTYLSFLNDSRQQMYYKLDPGAAYFVNTSVLHRGFAVNCGPHGRVFLHIALDNDKPILDGEILQSGIDMLNIDIKYIKGPDVDEFWTK